MLLLLYIFLYVSFMFSSFFMFSFLCIVHFCRIFAAALYPYLCFPLCFLSCTLCISVASLRQPYILIYVFNLCFLSLCFLSYMFSFLYIVHFCRIFATALIIRADLPPFSLSKGGDKGVIRGLLRGD